MEDRVYVGAAVAATCEDVAKTLEARDGAQVCWGLLGPEPAELSRLGGQTFAPRLVVVRVALGIWHQTVSSLASVAIATIVDLSEPTENLMWEISELTRLGGHDRCIFIVDHARLDETGNFRDGGAGFAANLKILIGDGDVLAYRTDRAGMRRFARALYGRLLDLPARELSPG